MSQPHILQNAFDTKTINQLLRKLQFVSFDQTPEKVMKDIQQLSPDQYLWAVCHNPAYFVQYQLKSAAVLKVKNMVLIVWKPKYIEYPSMVKFPELKDKKPANLNITFTEDTTTNSQCKECLTQYLEGFYSTFFHSDSDFQTNLVTNSKHLISRVTKQSYWHAIIDNTDSLFVTQMSKMGQICKIRITGMKEGYDKTLLLFSLKGKRVNFFTSAKSKWMQILSFLSMLLIFCAVTACSSDSEEGICAYRQQMTMAGTGIMFSLIGMRYIKDKKTNKKKTAPKAVNPQKKRD